MCPKAKPKRKRKREYEFSKEENKVFASLSRWMIILAIVIIIGGIATILSFVLDVISVPVMSLALIVTLVSGIMYCIMGLTFYFPTDNFKRIVTTKGKDITELMTAFREVDRGWLIVNIVTLIVVILMFASIFI
jgi:hypothetical protein